MSDFELPERGIVFWPVGVGDSSTVVIDAGTVLQIDIHHLEAAEDEEDPRIPIVDRLIELLPKVDGKPYLAGFAATHLDKDHVLGFAELLDRVTIGDLWFTPRVFRDVDEKELCDDGKVFVEEAERRIEAVRKNGTVGSGDRVRVIGHDDLLSEPPYSDLPKETFVIPGEFLTAIDGTDYKDIFRAFVHAPFKDDGSKDRNDTSLALQITLIDETETLNALTFGDLSYPDLKSIFNRSKDDDLLWNALLAPHHCSKSAMYWPEEEGGDPKLRQDILDAVKKATDSPGVIVVSADKIPTGTRPATTRHTPKPPTATARSPRTGSIAQASTQMPMHSSRSFSKSRRRAPACATPGQWRRARRRWPRRSPKRGARSRCPPGGPVSAHGDGGAAACPSAARSRCFRRSGAGDSRGPRAGEGRLGPTGRSLNRLLCNRATRGGDQASPARASDRSHPCGLPMDPAIRVGKPS